MGLARAEIRGGQVLGAAKPMELRASEEHTDVHELHATLLRLPGLDHERLTYLHYGREQRETELAGTATRRTLNPVV